jgi:hypothetical protein
MAIENRGFASVDTETMRRIASEGGKAAHHYGTARKWTLEEAREAGRLGKRASDEAKRRKKAANAEASIRNEAVTTSNQGELDE